MAWLSTFFFFFSFSFHQSDTHLEVRNKVAIVSGKSITNFLNIYIFMYQRIIQFSNRNSALIVNIETVVVRNSL